MEITIGVQHVARELTLEVSEDADAVTDLVNEALAKAQKDAGAALVLTSTKGRTVIVPVSSLGFVEFGGEEVRRVGFGTL